jgi:predicted nucleic acid binding AN1-type Zn finger protein
MVELLGTHCEYPECNTLDFLPIYCNHCSKTFCKKHGSAPDHSCVSLLETTPLNSSSSSSFLPCAYLNNCKSQKSPISFTCSLCLKNFCVEHRHIDDHQCPYRSQTASTHYSSQLNKNEIKPITTNFPTEKFVGTKNETLANKVAIMKLKQTAKGPTGVPMENRLHIFVQIDDDNGNKRYPFYLSKLWPLGKGLDYLIKELKLLPANWIILLNGEQTPLDLSTTISELKRLHDADVIILKKN